MEQGGVSVGDTRSGIDSAHLCSFDIHAFKEAVCLVGVINLDQDLQCCPASMMHDCVAQ